MEGNLLEMHEKEKNICFPIESKRKSIQVILNEGMRKLIYRKRIALILPIIGCLALLGFLVIPKIPQLLTITGVQGKFTAGTIQPLEVGQPILDEIYIGTDGLTFVYEIPIDNPNPYSAHVDRITYNTHLGGKKLSEGGITGNTVIPANSRENITGKINLNLIDFLKAGGEVLKDIINDEKSYLELNGELHMDIASISVNLPFSRTIPIN